MVLVFSQCRLIFVLKLGGIRFGTILKRKIPVIPAKYSRSERLIESVALYFNLLILVAILFKLYCKFVYINFHQFSSNANIKTNALDVKYY